MIGKLTKRSYKRSLVEKLARAAPLPAKEAIHDPQARRPNGEKLNFHVEPAETETEAATNNAQDTDPLCPAA